jgi:glycogen phosphorylase
MCRPQQRRIRGSATATDIGLTPRHTTASAGNLTRTGLHVDLNVIRTLEDKASSYRSAGSPEHPGNCQPNPVTVTCVNKHADEISEAAASLTTLAYNLRWSWHAPTRDLFRTIAPELWDATHNPVVIGREVVTRRADVLTTFASQLAAARRELGTYMNQPPQLAAGTRVAYFSAEYAIAECLPLYAGGLGVLAGDHIKAASDLGVPLVAIGLLYRHGYFHQSIDADGRQREAYERLDPTAVPLRSVTATDGVPLEVGIPINSRIVRARAWLAQVGRVRLYLLDTDIDGNREDDRWITGHLYGGDGDTRLRQEMVLGIGGVRLLRLLRVLGLEVAPQVYHLNEGHSSLAALELAGERLRIGLSGGFAAAHAHVANAIAFTTHTPVRAGHDSFPAELIEAYLGDYRGQLGLTLEELMGLGRSDRTAESEPFNMTILALRSAQARNGVSQLHGQVSREMWKGIGVGQHDTPPRIQMLGITNGVHSTTWAGPEMGALFDRVLGHAWRTAPHRSSTWSRLENIDPAALWAARYAQRARLLERVDASSRASGFGGLGPSIRDGSALVVGFARRFATYKRAGLVLEDQHRLARLIGDPNRPIVLLFAGKAHPSDEPGKQLVRRVAEASRDARFAGRLVFLPEYDIELARLLVQGADLWLNTPRRPQEASGTSGMKAVLNGALQLSELDGWWDEAYAPEFGWALGDDIPDYIDGHMRDQAEARQLLALLENDVIPLFFQRDSDAVPVAWLSRVRRAIEALAGPYSAHRMVTEYVERVYQRLGTSARLSGMPTLARAS